MSDRRQYIRSLENAAQARGEPLAWYEELYRRGDTALIPWADLRPNPFIALDAGEGRSAIVVGCGLGDDAEYVASLGWRVTAFDLSPSAVAWAQRRFPQSSVHYRVANLLEDQLGRFDQVLEIYTIQSMPLALRQRALHALAGLVGGRLQIICRGADETVVPETGPVPLTRADLAMLEAAGLREVSFEDFQDPAEPVRRFRANYAR